MAYPDRIKETGPLPGSEIFDYFKDAMLDTSLNPERWPWAEFTVFGELYRSFFSTGEGVTPLTFPCVRSDFYGYMNTWTQGDMNENDNYFMFHQIGGVPLYSYASPLTGWPITAVNDWAKMKCLELAFFGSIGNGSDLSAPSIVGSGSIGNVIPNLKVYDLGLLRMALVHFDEYPVDFVDDLEYRAATPTSPVQNVPSRTFGWTFSPGFTSSSNYEYSVNGNYMGVTPSNPMAVEVYDLIPIGGLQVNVRKTSGSYMVESQPISNTVAYPAVPLDINIQLDYFAGYGSIAAGLNTPVSETDISIEVYIFVGGNSFVEDLNIPAGETFTSKAVSYPPGTPEIQNVIVTPSEVNGREINIIIL